MSRPADVFLDRPHAGYEAPARDLDLHSLVGALKRRRRTIAGATLGALVLVGIFVNVVTPRYMAEAQVLLENQETFFTRPDRTPTPSEQSAVVDPEAVGSQIQLITSRDLANRAVKALHLQGDPEFDPSARGLSALGRVLMLLGLSRDPTHVAASTRVAQAFQEKLTVFSPTKTRVIAIQFQSKDPDVAARAANEIADLYIAEQSNAKRTTAKDAADALGAQIADLRVKLAQADAERESYRAQSGLLAGTNNMTITGQQLADINSDLSKARTAQADAQAKAGLLRDLIRSGKTADVPEVINNDLVRRVSEQRVTAQAQLAQESRTLLPGHPRIKELSAQVAGLDTALKAAAKQAMTTLENEAKIAGQRVANLETVLTQQKKIVGAANGDEVHLRSLDRIAQSYKDQLDSSMTKYQEAMARQTSSATPADARIIARAVPPQDAVYPKKLAFIGFGVVATLVATIALVIAAEMLKSSATGFVDPAAARVAPVPDRVEALPVRAAPVQAAPSLRRVSPVIRPPLRSRWDAFVEGLRRFGRPAVETAPATPLPGLKLDEEDTSPAPEAVGATVATDAMSAGTAIESMAATIVGAHVPGRGLHVVGTNLAGSGAEDFVALGRRLAQKGRCVVVDLNATPERLDVLTAGDWSEPLPGLSDLLGGVASFAEVINRDRASRLHFIATGAGDADFRDFDLILDALSETYDFVLLLAPSYPASEIAKVMAPYAHFVVLGGVERLGAKVVRRIEGEMVEAGAQEVLVAGGPVLQSSAA